MGNALLADAAASMDFSVELSLDWVGEEEPLGALESERKQNNSEHKSNDYLLIYLSLDSIKPSLLFSDIIVGSLLLKGLVFSRLFTKNIFQVGALEYSQYVIWFRNNFSYI